MPMVSGPPSMMPCLNARYISGRGTTMVLAPRPRQVSIAVFDSQMRSFRPSRSFGVRIGRTAIRPRGSFCIQVQSVSSTMAPSPRSLSSPGLKRSLLRYAWAWFRSRKTYGAEMIFVSSIRPARNSGYRRCRSCAPCITFFCWSGMPPSLPAWNTSTFICPAESFATSAANASAPTPECDVCASTVPSFNTTCACAAAPMSSAAMPANSLCICPPLSMIPAYDLTPAGSGKTSVAQRLHAVHHDMPHAARQLIRFERRRGGLERFGVEHRDVRAIAFRKLPAIGEPQPPRRQLREPLHCQRGSQQLAFVHHEMEIPRGPRIGTVEHRIRERPIRRKRGGIRAGHAERMREHERLLVRRVGMDDHHRAVGLIQICKEDVERDVIGIASFLARELAEALARILRESRMVEQHHALPAPSGDDALVLPHLFAALRRAQMPREIVLRPKGHDGVQERRAV